MWLLVKSYIIIDNIDTFFDLSAILMIIYNGQGLLLST